MAAILIKPEYLSATLFCKILKEHEDEFKRNGIVSERFFRELAVICGTTLLRACECLDKNRVVRYRNNADTRYMYKVTGKTTHTVLPDVNFCTCEHYVRQVLLAQTALVCKHVLAVKIAEVTGRVVEEQVTDSQLTDLLNIQFSHLFETNCMENIIC